MKDFKKIYELIDLSNKQISPKNNWKGIIRIYIEWIFAILIASLFIFLVCINIKNWFSNTYIIPIFASVIFVLSLTFILLFLKNYFTEKAMYYYQYDLHKTLKYTKLNFAIRLLFSYLKEIKEVERSLKKSEFVNKNEKLFYKYFDYFDFNDLNKVYEKWLSNTSYFNKYYIFNFLVVEYNLGNISFDVIGYFVSKNRMDKEKLERVIIENDPNIFFYNPIYNSYNLFSFLKIQKIMSKKQNYEIRKNQTNKLLISLTLLFSIMWYGLIIALSVDKSDVNDNGSIIHGIFISKKINVHSIVSIIGYILIFLYCSYILIVYIKNFKEKNVSKPIRVSTSLSIILSIFISISYIISFETLAYLENYSVAYILSIAFPVFSLLLTILLFCPLGYLYIDIRNKLRNQYIREYVEDNINDIPKYYLEFLNKKL